ncbi:MAG: MHS family MFS transporter [Alphaproteobacteria bacterium]|nr:MHS family MFS transporter [Alphaproteobacteria bacterium]
MVERTAATGLRPRRSRAELTRVAFASAVGSALEWYDFFIYGTAAALAFNDLFFPKFDPAIGTLAAFAAFGVGFLARPFGGLFFGHFGDRIGRKPMLVMTLLLVGVGTFIIGLLPTYATLGEWAPVLLVLMRLVQGFGAGAEYGGAVIFAVEYAPEGRRGLFGSWAPIGVTTGNLMAAGVFALVNLMPREAFLAWGWRIPFLLSIVLVALGLYIRARIAETPVFAEVASQREPIRVPGIEAIRRHPRNFLVVIGARMAENGLGYLFPVFGLSYITGTLHLPRETALLGVFLGNFAEIIGIPYFSWLSDRIGRRPVYLGGALFSAVFAFPFFWLVDTGSTALIVLAFVCVMGIGAAAMFGPQAAYFAELFGPRLRYSGFAFARELGSILAGGPAPFLSGLLVFWMGGAPWGVAIYVIVLALITAGSIWVGPETYTSDLEAEPAAAAE